MAALEAEADAIFEAFAHMRQGERANRREAQRSDPAPEAAPQQVSVRSQHRVQVSRPGW